jgi:hypothetical protein
MEKVVDKQPVIENIKTLGVYESTTFPISRTWVVRGMITNFCLTSVMRFKTTTSRKNGTITVTRIK